MAGKDVIVWGRASSANVQKVVWALEEMGTPYERKDLGGRFGGLDTPQFGAMNPNRLVPVLQHGEFVLWESHAIVRYLAAIFGAGTLWPTDPQARGIVDQWTDWTASTFQPAWLGVFWLTVRTPPDKHDQAAIADAIDKTVSAFRIMERQLETSPYLAGDHLTYADIVAGASLYRWFTMDIERPSLPAVEAWHQRMLARPAFEKAVCVSYEELRARTVP